MKDKPLYPGIGRKPFTIYFDESFNLRKEEIMGKGILVQHKKTKKIGRTYTNKESVKGKLQVFYSEATTMKEYLAPGGVKFSQQAVLVSPENLQQIGFID